MAVYEYVRFEFERRKGKRAKEKKNINNGAIFEYVRSINRSRSFMMSILYRNI